jgi:hypothetical protein
VAVVARLGVDWHTVWDAIKPVLAELVDDPARLIDTWAPTSTSGTTAVAREGAEGTHRDRGP